MLTVWHWLHLVINKLLCLINLFQEDAEFHHERSTSSCAKALMWQGCFSREKTSLGKELKDQSSCWVSRLTWNGVQDAKSPRSPTLSQPTDNIATSLQFTNQLYLFERILLSSVVHPCMYPRQMKSPCLPKVDLKTAFTHTILLSCAHVKFTTMIPKIQWTHHCFPTKQGFILDGYSDIIKYVKDIVHPQWWSGTSWSPTAW